MTTLRSTILSICLVLFILSDSSAQKARMLDQVVAIVGEEIVMQSDIENQVLQMRAQNYYGGGDLKCTVLEDLLVQKLLLNQAALDSIDVSMTQVEQELEMRLRYFIRQVGSQQKLEEYYNKSLQEIKEDFRPIIYDQKLTENMQREIFSGIKVSPREVRDYYKSLPKDSIPMVNAEMKISQVVLYPPDDHESKMRAREKLLELRERILNGERFSTLAVLYSEDPGTASKGGELGFRSREELDPAFASAAFSLQEGKVSKIVESSFGFHIIELIAREGDQVNVRHILIRPKVSIDKMLETTRKLDSVAQIIKSNKMTFKEAALKFSEDEASRRNDGMMINPSTASLSFQMDQLPAAEYEAVKDLSVGEISEPFEAEDEEGNPIYKIVRIESKSEPHRATLEDDYNKLEQMAIMNKREEVLNNWIDEKRSNTYIHIDDSFINCRFLKQGWIK